MSSEKMCIGYWGTWAGYRLGDGKFDYSHIDPKLFTHLIYTFFGVSTDGDITHLDEEMDLRKDGGYIKKFIELKSLNSNIKLMAAVGGYNFGGTVFSQIAKNQSSRISFATKSIEFLKKFGFDGLDVDWEYPEGADKANFVLMLEELRSAFDKSGHILSVAVGAAKWRVQTSYDVSGIAKNAHLINLMTYDLHGPWDNKTGSHTALYAGPDPSPDLNNDACVKNWLNEGAPKEKLVLGLATYGKTFKLADASKNDLNDTSIGAGDKGKYTGQEGMLAFYEICENNWTRHWQKEQLVPYASNGDQWVSYDDVESMKAKAEYINEKELAGGMFWSIETDDFRGKSGQGKFPLIKTVRDIIKKS